VKRSLIQSLHNRASTICKEQQNLVKEIRTLRSDFQLNGYPQGFIDFIDSVINSKGRSRLNKAQKPLDSVYITHVNGVSENFMCISIQNQDDLQNQTIFSSSVVKPGWKEIRYRLRSSSAVSPVYVAEAILWKQTDLQPRGSGNTSRNLNKGLLEISKLGQHACE
jgi:hypothetical protein